MFLYERRDGMPSGNVKNFQTRCPCGPKMICVSASMSVERASEMNGVLGPLDAEGLWVPCTAFCQSTTATDLHGGHPQELYARLKNLL